MRPSLLILGAASYVAAQSCNPTFNVSSTSDCIKNCGINAGKAIDPKFTLDSNSADFVSSVSLLCSGKQNPDYLAFMTSAGTCWASCPKEDQTGYTSTEYPATCKWFEAHKNDKCDGSATNNNSNSTSNNNNSNSSNTSGNKENASYRLQASGVVGLLALGVTALLY
ncbi:unnamed protein product [Cunninghamella blakesleeana]